MAERQNDYNQDEQEYEEVVVEIKRTSKKTKGGDRLSFTCLAVVGDKAGQVGVGLGKAPSVRPAVQKAMRKAKSSMISFPMVGKAKTIPHEIEVENGATHIMLKPAPAGTGIRAGGAIRSVLEVAGIENIVAKRLGSSSKKTNVDTTLLALTSLQMPSQRIYKRKEKPTSNAKKEKVAKEDK